MQKWFEHLSYFKKKMKNIFIGLCVYFLFGNEFVRGQKFSLGALGFGSGTSPLEKFQTGHVAQSAVDTLKGVASKIPSAIPTPDTIFSVGKNVLAGYPVEAAFKAINMFCKYIYLICGWVSYQKKYL